MLRLLPGLALAALMAACTTTDGAQVAASGDEAAPLPALEPAGGTSDAAAAAETDETDGTEVAALDTGPAETGPAEETPAVDDKANAYLNCVVARAARESQAGQSDDAAVEVGVDACRNQFREARWAYLDSGVSESEADRYGVNLLTFVRDEAYGFLQSGT